MSITVESLTKTYPGGITALQAVNLEVPVGIFGLLGPNGAGKTTLLRILAGVLAPTEGEVRICGHLMSDPDDRRAAQRVFGYLPQRLGFYPELTAVSFLDYVALLKGLDDRRFRRDRVAELLEQVGLADVAHRKLRTYSEGMRRRVGIAQALLSDPKVLVVDEATAGLDPEERLRFRNLLATMGTERAVVLSTHIVEDVAACCRSLAVLVGGRIAYCGLTAALTEEARGRVWSLTLPPGQPVGDAWVVSVMPGPTGVCYRLIADTDTVPEDATLTEATLEDGYLALAHAAAGSTP